MAVVTQPFQGVFTADPDHSSFLFAVQHMKVSSFRASFSDVDARLQGDDAGVRLAGSARVASISITNPPEFREHVVRGEDFFDADRHPEISFRSERIDLREDGTLTLEGELTIKGLTRPLTATGRYQPPVDDPYGNVRAAIELTATVDRRDWNMGWQMALPKGGNVLGYDVELVVHLELVKQG
jgi:polyisoprenoid-binding protein YceI